MRVLLAGEFPEAPPKVIGGIQAVTWQLAEALERQTDAELRVFSSEKWWLDPQGAHWTRHHGGITAEYRQSPKRVPHVVSSVLEDAHWTKKAIEGWKPDVVHAHGQTGYAVGAIRSGSPLVVTPHGLFLVEKAAPEGTKVWSPAWLRQEGWTRLERWILQRTRHMIVISPYVEAAVAPLTKAKLHVIENPIAEDFFLPERPPAGSPVILTVGWMIPRKRQELLIEAVALARDSIPDLELHLTGNVNAGDHAHPEMLRTLAREKGVADAVRFLSDVPHETVLEEYANAAIYAHAAEEESSPMAVLQAMSAGLPVAAVDIPGIRHLVSDGATGRRVPAPDPAAISRVLVEMLRNPAALGAMGAAARAQARDRFHSAAIATKTLAVYAEAVDDAVNVRQSRSS